MNHLDKVEYYEIIGEILGSEEFQKRKYYKHHGDISVYDHSLAVSKISYILAKKFNCDYRSAAIAGLLHDFYYKPWQENNGKQKFLKKHGFVHAEQAMNNSYHFYSNYMNDKIANSILRHMFPLNKIPPKYIEGWFVTLADKYVSLEVFKQPTKLLMLIGIKKKVGV